tara:strand:+ start:398 stop:826 length:429 start_codon:yes stop_codon:yes gene_type:complete
MGLTNTGTVEVGHGFEVSNTYIFIKDIKISNDGFEYNIWCNAEEYVSRELKNNDKPKLGDLKVNYSSNTLPTTVQELWEQSYNEVKIFHPNTIDVLESNQSTNEGSGLTRWRLEEELTDARATIVTLTEDVRRKDIALQALT